MREYKRFGKVCLSCGGEAMLDNSIWRGAFQCSDCLYTFWCDGIRMNYRRGDPPKRWQVVPDGTLLVMSWERIE